MQIMIDTATDDPIELKHLGAWLVATFAPAAPSIEGQNDDSIPLHPEPRRGAGAVEEATAGLAEAVARLPVQVLPPPIPPPPGPAPSQILDSAGVPWSSALHTSTKAKTIDGRWKARKSRGGSPVVPAGTQAMTPLPAPAPVPVPPIPVTLPLPIPPPPNVPPVSLPSVDTDPDVTVEPDAVPEGATPGIDFPTFITKIGEGMADQSITQSRIAEVLAKFKLGGLFDLNTRPDLVAEVAAEFGITA